MILFIIARARMYFGNIQSINGPWRRRICANIGQPATAGQPSVARLPLRIGRRMRRAQSCESERMGFFSELRHPTTWYTKLVIAVLALGFFGLLVVTATAGYLIYRMVLPAHTRSQIDLQNFIGHPEVLIFTVSGEGSRDGWFFPGLKSAPTIILCPAYESSRAELLTLASALQDHQYNVFVFDFSAHGSTGGRSTLGFQEVGELRAAINAVANRGDVDVNRFGLWGVNMGAYAALAEATTDRRVRALAVESPYDHPKDMVALMVGRSGLGKLPFFTRTTQQIFQWLNPQFRRLPPVKARIANLSGVPQLYLESPDDPALAASTTDLFQASPPPHELVALEHGNYAGMMDEEKRSYENRIVSFFLGNLPPTSEFSAIH